MQLQSHQDVKYMILSRISGCASPDDFAEKLTALLESELVEPGVRLPTIREMARTARMSPNALSRVLNDLADAGLLELRRGTGIFVRERNGKGETARTNSRAASRPKRTRLIGVVSPHHSGEPFNVFAAEILHGICSEAALAPHRVESVHHQPGAARRFDFFEHIMSLKLDGVIWIQPYVPIPMALVRLVDAHVPLVLTGRSYPDFPAPVVRDDLEAFGEQVAGYLEARNRKKLLFLGGQKDDLHTTLRVQALRHSLEKRGLALPDSQVLTAHLLNTYSLELGEVVTDFLRKHEDFDAIFAVHWEVWEPIVRLHDAGEAVCGKDFDAIHLEQSVQPIRSIWPTMPFVLVRPPQHEIGRAATQMIESLWGEKPSSEAPSLAPTLDCPHHAVAVAARSGEFHTSD